MSFLLNVKYLREKLFTRAVFFRTAVTLTGILAVNWLWPSNDHRTRSVSVATCPPLDQRPLRVGITPWAGFAGGILANNGLHAVKNSAPDSTHALGVEFLFVDGTEAGKDELSCSTKDGGVDVLWSSIQSWPAEFSEFRKAGVEARAVMQIAQSNSSCGLVADAAITDPVSLASDRLGTPSFSPAHWLAEQMAPHDRILPVKDSAAVLKGFVDSTGEEQIYHGPRFDAVALCEPFLQEALDGHKDAHRLEDPAGPREITYILVTRLDLIENRASASVLKNVIKKWLDFNLGSGAKRDKVADLLVERARPDNNTDEYLERIKTRIRRELRTVQMASLADNQRLFGVGGGNSSYESEFKAARKLWANDIQPFAPQETKYDAFISQVSGPVNDPDLLCRLDSKDGLIRKITISFGLPGNATLPADTEAKLRNIVSDLKNEKYGALACIEGYADNSPTETRNQDLRRERAAAVRDYLYDQGVDSERLVIREGPLTPQQQNATPRKQAANRKAIIRVIMGGM